MKRHDNSSTASPLPTIANFERIRVVVETLSALGAPQTVERYHEIAAANLARWQAVAGKAEEAFKVEVRAEDWGIVAGEATRRTGCCWAVLNMANADIPGGGYFEGMSAQEENMFRRTDCHLSIDPNHVDKNTGLYNTAMKRLISGNDGRVYLDTNSPRVCIRGPEIETRKGLGYDWLDEEDIFPFFEMRSAAQNCALGDQFDRHGAKQRIEAQLNTLVKCGIRHVVLSAFGCGAFANPAEVIASLYREAIKERQEAFTHIIFAVHDVCSKTSNLETFSNILQST